jgi:hypothetical protein
MTDKHSERGAGGRFKAREARIVGPLNQPTGPGGIDTTTGRWIPGVRNNAQLHDLDRVHAVDSRQLRYQAPDYSRDVADDRKTHDRVHANEEFIQHVLGCPACAVGGFVHAGDGIPNIFGEEEIG